MNATHPHAPPDDCVAMSVPGGAHDARVDELRGDVGIDHANDKRRYNNEGKRAFPVILWTKTAKSGRGGILSQVPESNCRRNDEQECGDASQDS